LRQSIALLPNVNEQILFMPGRGFLLTPTHDLPVILNKQSKDKRLTERKITENLKGR
jgi:hypothetical protein